MSWYTTVGKAPEHVIRSETKYIRNLKNHHFNCRIDKVQKDLTVSKLEKLLEANGFKKELDPRSGISELFSYAEKGFCDADAETLANRGDKIGEKAGRTESSLYFNEPCSLSVAIGGADMLVIRSLLSGFAISETQSIALEAEELFDREFEFAYSNEIGYLSPFLHNCGSGEFFSVLLFLPALGEKGEIDGLAATLSRMGVSLTPLFKDNTCGIYTLSHSPHHLCDHVRDMELFCALTEQIIEKEKHAESIIFSEKRKIIIEDAHRSLGILLYAHCLSESELIIHLKNLRLALLMRCEIASMPQISFSTLNRILAECMSFSVLSACPDCKNEDELDEQRAILVRKHLSADNIKE